MGAGHLLNPPTQCKTPRLMLSFSSSSLAFFTREETLEVLKMMVIRRASGVAVEALTNDEEVELRSKIEALGLEVTKVPSSSTRHLDELEIAKELDKLSMKLDDVDEMISSAIASDPHVQSLLSGTADIWMPVITASADERRNFAGPTGEGDARESEKAPM
ncbi:hypothetical protein ACJRO7_029395 [Eucalyptus globulus]|uniref:Uncharacterized protein n=1 Tax=Eucalyptus globulus TaxID=34317 RepID=A0ABD3JYD7_EUCGL